MGFFGQATNSLSFCLSLLGTSAVIRSLGLQRTLLLFPCLLLAAGAIVYIIPSLGLVFATMLALKAFSYALNNAMCILLVSTALRNEVGKLLALAPHKATPHLGDAEEHGEFLSAFDAN